MDGEPRYTHPVDYEVHPRAGVVSILVGAAAIAGAILRSPGTVDTGLAADLIMGLGIMSFGAAVRTPAGRARRWLLRAAFGSLLLWIAIPLGAHLLG